VKKFEGKMSERLKERFKNPGAEFWGAPFWSWDDDLTEEI